LAGTTYNDVRGDVSKMRPVGVTKKGKTERVTHVDVASWNSACWSCPGGGYIFHFSWK